MLRVAITGLGFMGSMHFKCYEGLENVKIVAICDINENKLKDASGTAGNIEGTEGRLDLTGVELYTDFDKMLADANLDAISIALPTYLHPQYTIKTLEAGVNVLCEKPMAMDSKQCDQMIAAANKSNKILQVGHCIRFWPEYVKTKEIIDSGKYGKVKAATFQRLVMAPTTSWSSWMMDGERSGGASFDLHIHDTDYVSYVFGMPKAVSSFGVKGPTEDIDHIVSHYLYEDEKVITTEGGWMMMPAFGFEMSFHIVLQKGSIIYNCARDPAFKICPAQGDAFTPKIEEGDGYSRQIAHFVKAVAGESIPEITSPEQSKNSVKIVEAEKESVRTGKRVEIS